ncbi:MAG TPA: NAD-dependent epimerase/dehydratase family protein [Acidimicrobiia bacterium]|nr:NAD-dependent epimerase/dehydratase family protein [Acidimicrobiia bacterium]
MVSIAVTGASGLVGGALVAELADAPEVTRIVGIDVRVPQRQAPGLEFRLADVAHSELKPLLEGVDVLVHLASVVDPIPDEHLMARINVGGTRRALDAAAAVGVRKVVRVSSTAVYGAWANNAVPLDEDAALRPNAAFTPAVQGAEIERLLAEWREDHPGVVVTTLRSAPVLGPGAERLPSRLLLGRPALRLRNAAPLLQATHVDDLVAALALVVLEDHPGTFNVAADGWLEPADLRALLPPSLVPALPAGLVERLLARSWATGLGDIPPGVVPYLRHPWVVANDRLKAIGWRPRHSNEEAVRDGLAAMGPPPRRGALAGAVLAAALGAGLTAWLLRRRRGARRARRPTRR